MTKVRAPLTVERAMIRVAEVIGFDGMAAAISMPGEDPVSESAVRNWSNPDTPQRCPLEACPKFDVAYQKAGGDGSPMLEWLDRAIDQERRRNFGGRFDLGRLLCSALKETGEAHVAMALSALPDATERDDKITVKEIEEAIASMQQYLAGLTRSERHTGTGGASPGVDQ